ncbi:MAG: MFS transporter [Candidatus Competibacteraceae bacterium]|nr:MFS transporter [Candidatus Competibacteraceae bacterium]MCP5125268.1 MFS transporter [Gammaproteobacteria bacterium]HRX71409.1 MFS transporter [Candidatus Competibacteraceae bacterium]
MKAADLTGERMTVSERRAAFWLAGVFSLRMLGLFMILPVFALYAEHLQGNTPALAGLAIGVYGFSQAIFQIPFGFLSDRYGRKRIIYLGLLIFALGSVVAALAGSIWGVILGRALQGGGAVSAAAMALVADLTREEHRIKVMALIGITIGLSFAVSMVLGPALNGWIGVPGIFWLTGVLALLGITIVRFRVPDPVVSRIHRDAEPVASQFGRVLSDGQLLRLDFGIFTLHLLLTATFVATPLALRDAGLASEQHWRVYLPALILSIVAMAPFVIIAGKQRGLKPVFLGAILTLALTEFGLLAWRDTVLDIGLLLIAFFTSFNLLEATLPSLIARMAPSDAKGTAMGIYSSSQFLGAFTGGALGGILHGRFGLQGVFAFAALGALSWLLVAWTMDNPRHLSNRLLNIGACDEVEARHLAARLSQVPGVAEAVVIAAEGVAYLKVDRRILDEAALRELTMANAQPGL